MKTFKPLACSTRVISDYTLKSCRGCNAKRLSAAINLNRIKKKKIKTVCLSCLSLQDKTVVVFFFCVAEDFVCLSVLFSDAFIVYII